MTCPECGASKRAEGARSPRESWFCHACGMFLGRDCPACDRTLELRQGLCECGEVSRPPAELLGLLREGQRLARERSESISSDADGGDESALTAPRLPGSEWPALTFDVVLEGLLGMTAKEVRGVLGKPSQSRAGLRTPGPDDPHLFGPRPVHLPARASYSEWSYHNVDGLTWLLWFARPGTPRQILSSLRRRTGAAVVIEASTHPTGAVF